MGQFLKEILNISWVNTLLGFIGGAIISYIFYKLSIIGAIPTYIVKNIKLLDKNHKLLPKDVVISYKNQEIPQLSKTFIILWNNGKKTIIGDQIVKNDKLSINFSEEVKILAAKIVKYTKDTNKFKIIDIDGSRCIFEFEFLHPKDGVTIEILHTGDTESPKIQGTFLDIPEGIVQYKPLMYKLRFSKY